MRAERSAHHTRHAQTHIYVHEMSRNLQGLTVWIFLRFFRFAACRIRRCCLRLHRRIFSNAARAVRRSRKVPCDLELVHHHHEDDGVGGKGVEVRPRRALLATVGDT